jgi:regulatory protein
MPSKQPKPVETAEATVLRLLGRRDYSRSELRRKLTGKGFPAGEADGVLARFEARGLVNDWNLAQRLASFYSREKLWGPQKLLHKLVQRGIPVDMVRQVIDLEEESGGTPERLKALLKHKLKGRDSRSLSGQDRRRLANYLQQRGYAWDDIWEALQEIGGSIEE